MKLSNRLLAVADMVTPGFVLADIGTDHAYIPIYLVENNSIPRAYAMDVNRGPLARAAEHIHAHGLADRIETRLSDGLAALRPGEAQSIVIAGMGGALTVRILQKGAEQHFYYIQELILQPQSEVPQVRAYLEQAGFAIVQENMVFEDGKYYPMMKTVPGKAFERNSFHAGTERDQGQSGQDTENRKEAAGTQMTDIQISRELQMMFGPELLRMRHPVLYRYLLHERATQERILESLAQNAGADGARQRMPEVQREIQLIDEALAFFSAD